MGDGYSGDAQGWQAHLGECGALRTPRTIPGIVHCARPCSDPMEDFVLLLTLWLLKNNFSGPGSAGARCVLHNAPFIQASSVAMADTMTLLICPTRAWLPKTSVPTQYNCNCRYEFKIYFQAKKKKKKAPPPSLCFKTNKSNWHIFSTCACSSGALKKETCFPPPRFLVSPPSLPTAPHSRTQAFRPPPSLEEGARHSR